MYFSGARLGFEVSLSVSPCAVDAMLRAKNITVHPPPGERGPPPAKIDLRRHHYGAKKICAATDVLNAKMKHDGCAVIQKCEMKHDGCAVIQKCAALLWNLGLEAQWCEGILTTVFSCDCRRRAR